MLECRFNKTTHHNPPPEAIATAMCGNEGAWGEVEFCQTNALKGQSATATMGRTFQRRHQFMALYRSPSLPPPAY